MLPALIINPLYRHSDILLSIHDLFYALMLFEVSSFQDLRTAQSWALALLAIFIGLLLISGGLQE